MDHFLKQLLTSSFLLILLLSTCSNDDSINIKPTSANEGTNSIENQLKILSLGDSYTIGQSVCSTCRFPEQLKDSLEIRLQESKISLDIIAQTGWTTTNLQDAIISENPDMTYDLVTLLIGVNNQYQGKDFSIYEKEFPELLNQAITFASGKNANVLVVSIPDYAYTPFGQSRDNPESISEEIDRYNQFAQSICLEKDIAFINITDLSRKGLEDPNLVASDGLHPSEKAYSEFIKRIFPKAFNALN